MTNFSSSNNSTSASPAARCPFAALFGAMGMSSTSSAAAECPFKQKESQEVPIFDAAVSFSPLPIPEGPTKSALPFIGNHYEILASFPEGHSGPHAFGPKMVEKYGSFFAIDLPDNMNVLNNRNTPSVVCCDPDLLGEMFSKPEVFMKKGFKTSPLRKGAAGTGLFTTDDDEAIHDEAARILLPAFSQKGMREYFEIIADCTSTLASVFAAHATRGEMLDVHPMLSAYTFEVIGRVCFGKEHNAMTASPAHSWMSSRSEWICAANFSSIQRRRRPRSARL
jgi:cytochrome P450